MTDEFTSPLLGKTVLVTRGEKQAGLLSQLLKEHGASSLELAVIEIGEPSSWHALDTALGALTQYDWILFASVNAVSAVAERSTTFGGQHFRACGAKVAAIGPATQEKLSEYGVKTDFQPTKFVAEKFVSEFSSLHEVAGKRFLLPRTNAGRTVIADSLHALGGHVDMVEVYSTNLPGNKIEVSQKLQSLLASQKVDAVTFASSQTVRNFLALLRAGSVENDDCPNPVRALLDNVVIAAIGPVTAETARELLGRVDVEAQDHTASGLVKSLVHHFRDEKNSS